MPFTNIQVSAKESITVSQLMECPIHLTSLNNDVGMENTIRDENIYRPQLALAGYTEHFISHRIQLIGNTELSYLLSMSLEQRIMAFINIADRNVPVIILTNSHTLEPELLKIASEHNIAVLSTPLVTTKAIHIITEFLDDQFAMQGTVHGSFVDVYGVGILFVGRSGIGKSEIAMDLVERGHRLVADDVVVFTKKRDSVLMGTGTSLVKHFMEIRGLGIINVREMFGIRAIRFQKRLEILVELEDFDKQTEYERTGLDESLRNVMGVEISAVKLPIFPGKNITVISEVIALNYLLRTYGYHAPKEFANKLREEIERRTKLPNGTQDQRSVSYFQSDDE
jgi:HPr kinase/phosphorylase